MHPGHPPHTSRLFELIDFVGRSGDHKHRAELLVSWLTSPYAGSPGSGPVPHETLDIIVGIPNDVVSTCPDLYAALLFSAAVSFADAPTANDDAKLLVDRVHLMLGWFGHDPKVLFRLVGLVSFLVSRWTPTNQAEAARLANAASALFGEAHVRRNPTPGVSSSSQPH